MCKGTEREVEAEKAESHDSRRKWVIRAAKGRAGTMAEMPGIKIPGQRAKGTA